MVMIAGTLVPNTTIVVVLYKVLLLCAFSPKKGLLYLFDAKTVILTLYSAISDRGYFDVI